VLADIVLHTITGACTPTCLLAANTSVEAVTPPRCFATGMLTGCQRAGTAGELRSPGSYSIAPLETRSIA